MASKRVPYTLLVLHDAHARSRSQPLAATSASDYSPRPARRPTRPHRPPRSPSETGGRGFESRRVHQHKLLPLGAKSAATRQAAPPCGAELPHGSAAPPPHRALLSRASELPIGLGQCGRRDWVCGPGSTGSPFQDSRSNPRVAKLESADVPGGSLTRISLRASYSPRQRPTHPHR